MKLDPCKAALLIFLAAGTATSNYSRSQPTKSYGTSTPMPKNYFYQFGNDIVPGMNTFDIGLVAQYIECFYWGYLDWLDRFIHTSQYLKNGTFYDSQKIADLHLHSSELPVMMTDPVEMLDAMLKTSGYDPATFSYDKAIVSKMNTYYSQLSNGIDMPELIFFRSLFETLGDGIDDRFGRPFYADNQEQEISSITDSCAPYTFTSSHFIMPTTTNWYPSTSIYHGPTVNFYQFGNDIVPGMNTFDMGLVAQYIECFYWGYLDWLDRFIHTSQYLKNGTFYDSQKIADLHLHSSELPVMMTDPVEMLDAMLKTSGYDPATFSYDKAIVSKMNTYYSQLSNGIDMPELIFFRSLFETLGDGIDDRFGRPFYADNQEQEISSITDSCAPYTFTSSHFIMPTTTNWYPSTSIYHGPTVNFYQFGNDIVPGMNTFDMGLVAQYIECFYWGYLDWLDRFIHTSQYLKNGTFYDSQKIADLHLHSSELPVMMTDPVEMLDAMLKTSGYDPATFSYDKAIVSKMNTYYSQLSNGIDMPELIFFRSLFETLGDGIDDRFGRPFYADYQEQEISSITDSCAPYTFTSSHFIMPTTTNWYPSTSIYHGPTVNFYQFGNDIVPGMNTFDMGLVAQYIECFYWGYLDWLDRFIHTSQYLKNGTFYDSQKIADLHLHSSELPVMMTDPVEMLDAMLKTSGYDPATFSYDKAIVSKMNTYYSHLSNGIDMPELIFFRSLFETLGDGIDDRFGRPFYADNQEQEISSITDSCAPYTFTSSHFIMPTTTNWYPSTSIYHGPTVNFYQFGNDIVPGMNTFDMGLVAQYIECFYWGYLDWLDRFIHTSQYLKNGTFYDSQKIADLHLHSSELPVMMTDPVEMLDAMLKTSGYDPATFSYDKAIVSKMNTYYSQLSNGIDMPELIFFRSLFETLGYGIDDRFGRPFYADNQEQEISSITDSCAPYTFTSSHFIMPTTTNWYPSTSIYHGPTVNFYQFGNDIVPGMNTFDMGLVAQYIECFYWGYLDWLDRFIHTSQYLKNGTFYDSQKIADLHLHSSELPVMMTDPVEMLDAMLKTSGYDPATFSYDKAIVSKMNTYYSQLSNGIDMPELIFFRSLFETLGDGIDDRFGRPFYADNQEQEISSITDSCAPYTFTSSHFIMPTTTNWYPSTSIYHGPTVNFYQFGNDIVPGMNTFDMGLVAQYIECFYWGYLDWLDRFIHTSQYLKNGTFYDSQKIADLHLHSSELPVMMTDPVEMLDAMLKTSGYDPATFSYDKAIVSKMNTYYSQLSNGIDMPELIFFRSLFETLGDGIDDRFGRPFYADNQEQEISSITDSCAPYTFTSSHFIMPTTTNWYPSTSIYHGPTVNFYQFGNDIVPGMNTFDMGLVAQYIECFYWGYLDWLDRFIHTSQYLKNGTFYDSQKIADLHLHSSELPVMMTDPVEMLDAMLKTSGYDPATFSYDKAIVSKMNTYYSQLSNGIDMPELIFFRSLFETLGDGIDDRFGRPFYADNQEQEISSITDSCAPYTFTSSHFIMPTTTNWYPSTSIYHGPTVNFYQFGNDIVPGMNTFDMGLVAQYIECFYWGYLDWLDRFIHTSQYLKNGTFYDSQKIADLHLHSSELPVMMTDPVEMLDAMLKTSGYDPATFSYDKAIVSKMNTYYSQLSNGIDMPELIFFRSLFETLGDGIDDRFGRPFYADNQEQEISSITDSCAPYTFTSSHFIMPTTTNWYPSTSIYHGPTVNFYQFGNDIVPGMNTFDMGLVAQYIECFYWGYLDWLDRFIHTSQYLKNGTFYDSQKIADLHLHSSELPVMMTDPVEMLDAMLKTSGYDPATFSYDKAIVSKMNTYYSQLSNGIDMPELIFFRSLFETLGDGIDDRFGRPFYADNQEQEISSITDSCAPYTFTSSHFIMPTTTNWYPSTSIYHGPTVNFYQFGNDIVPGMNTFDMGLVAQYIECFYWGYLDWLDRFIHTSQYLKNGTFYDSQKIADLHLHSSELPVMMTDPVEMLDAMLKTSGYDPATFSYDKAIVSKMNTYYSQLSNGIDMPELIFFRSLFETLGDGIDDRFGRPFYADNQEQEISSITDSCAPYTFTSSHFIMPTTTNWYPSTSIYHGPTVNFYQFGNDIVPGMNTFDMGLVAQYIECFYWGYLDWLDRFIHTSQYLKNGTFYDSQKIADLHLHSSELPVMMTDPVEMLDAMLKTSGYDPATFSYDKAIVSKMNTYYSQLSNGIDMPELIFFRSLFETLGDGIDDRFGRPFYADNQEQEISSITDSCAPYTFTSSHFIMPTTTNWYPSTSIYHGPTVNFYQFGNDIVPGMNTFDMGLVAQYIKCFYWGYLDWLDRFIHTSQYLKNGTFYDSQKIADLHLHSSELPVMMTDPVEMLDAMLKTSGYDPATFSYDKAIVSKMNTYYSQLSNGIDMPELIFFRSLFETLGDGIDDRFGRPFYADNQEQEISSITDSCAPYTFTSSHFIMPTTTNWYPSTSIYHGPTVNFYQFGNDIVPGMNTFDMGLVAQYIECFYWGYLDWLDRFIHTSQYLKNGTFYDSQKIADLHLHSSELPVMMTDPVEMLDAMLKTSGYDPATFSYDKAIVSKMNTYYSQLSNGIDMPELIFFRSLFETLGDGIDDRFGRPFYADNQEQEISSITDSCAPYTFTSSHFIMPTTTNWYPSTSIYHGPTVNFYQFGNDIVPGMNTFDMGLVAQYIECFYWGYLDWLDRFIHTSQYLKNGTFYDSQKIADLHLHSSELPIMMTDPVEMLDAMLKTSGYDPATFSYDKAIVSKMNTYYSQLSNGIDMPELIFFRSLFETLGDGIDDRFGRPFYADIQEQEISSITDSCASYSYTSTHSIMPTSTTVSTKTSRNQSFIISKFTVPIPLSSSVLTPSSSSFIGHSTSTTPKLFTNYFTSQIKSDSIAAQSLTTIYVSSSMRPNFTSQSASISIASQFSTSSMKSQPSTNILTNQSVSSSQTSTSFGAVVGSPSMTQQVQSFTAISFSTSMTLQTSISDVTSKRDLTSTTISVLLTSTGVSNTISPKVPTSTVTTQSVSFSVASHTSKTIDVLTSSVTQPAGITSTNKGVLRSTALHPSNNIAVTSVSNVPTTQVSIRSFTSVLASTAPHTSKTIGVSSPAILRSSITSFKSQGIISSTTSLASSTIDVSTISTSITPQVSTRTLTPQSVSTSKAMGVSTPSVSQLATAFTTNHNNMMSTALHPSNTVDNTIVSTFLTPQVSISSFTSQRASKSTASQSQFSSAFVVPTSLPLLSSTISATNQGVMSSTSSQFSSIIGVSSSKPLPSSTSSINQGVSTSISSQSSMTVGVTTSKTPPSSTSAKNQGFSASTALQSSSTVRVITSKSTQSSTTSSTNQGITIHTTPQSSNTVGVTTFKTPPSSIYSTTNQGVSTSTTSQSANTVGVTSAKTAPSSIYSTTNQGVSTSTTSQSSNTVGVTSAKTAPSSIYSTTNQGVSTSTTSQSSNTVGVTSAKTAPSSIYSTTNQGVSTSTTSQSSNTVGVTSAKTAQSSTTDMTCVPGTGYCFFNSPNLGAHAGNLRPSVYLLAAFVVFILLVLH